jgi:hypothetical protein
MLLDAVPASGALPGIRPSATQWQWVYSIDAVSDFDRFLADCPARTTLGLIGHTWLVVVIVALGQRTCATVSCWNGLVASARRC